MERITQEPESYQDLVLQLTSNKIIVTNDYLNKVFSLGRLNRHCQGPSIVSPANLFASFNNWQKEAFKFYLDKAGIQPTYEKIGYDFSFLNI